MKKIRLRIWTRTVILSAALTHVMVE